MDEHGDGLRLTPRRQAVLDVLRSAHDHPTASEVYHRVHGRQPGIGAATVYRTLALLVRSGVALELSLGGESGAARYDANTVRHDHLVCDGCGRVVDVDFPVPPRSVGQLAARTGFTVTSYDLQFHGHCPRCTRSAADPPPVLDSSEPSPGKD